MNKILKTYTLLTLLTIAFCEVRASHYLAGDTAVVVVSHGVYTADTMAGYSADSIACDSTSLYADSVTARRSRRGIIIAGHGDSIRAMDAFGYRRTNGEAFAAVVNRYSKAFGKEVTTSCMLIPTASAYYCPESMTSYVSNQNAAINDIYSMLRDDVKAINIYDTLSHHSSEGIYLRTDHHWAPLGAYYAAEAYANALELPFHNLNCYDTLVVNNFCGSMATFTRDKEVKNATEPFVYFVPRDVEYKKTSIRYRVNRRRKPYAERPAVESTFFKSYPDGSSAAYCTFMGGDARTVKVVTSTKNGRRLLILKDSFGNALPGYLFHSFEEIHVIDYRYFLRKVKPYVKKHAITDVLFAHNMTHSCLPSTVAAYNRILGR